MSGAQKWGLLSAVVLVSIVAVFALVPPIAQSIEFHEFSDRRAVWRIPNFADVMSSAAFVAAGLYGLWVLSRSKAAGEWGRDARVPLGVMFMGVILVAPGSAYYHWAPDNAALFWDRLPMTVAFMGLLAAVAADRIRAPVGGRIVLALLVIVGVASVLYWRLTNDLRAYGLVQFLPVLIIPLIMWLWPNGKYITWRAVGWLFLAYALAKLCEHFDGQLFRALGGVISGHGLKHLFAAMGPAILAWTLRDQS